MEWGVRSVKCRVGSVECNVWSVGGVWSVKCKVWSGKWGLWSVKCEGVVWSVKCRVCGVSSVKWGV